MSSCITFFKLKSNNATGGGKDDINIIFALLKKINGVALF